jgi:hypothetical protein
MVSRDITLLADRLVHEHAGKIALVQGIELEAAVETVWESLESGLLRFVVSDDHIWIEPNGRSPGERRAARTATHRLLKCRKPTRAPTAAVEGRGCAPQPRG